MIAGRILNGGDQIENKMKEGKNIPMIRSYEIPSFKPLFSFGESYESKTPMVIDKLTSGNISCNNTTSTVVFSFSKMPVLHGYSAKDGHLKWKSSIDGLHTPHIIETKASNGATKLTYKVSKGKFNDTILPIVHYTGKYEFLSVRRRRSTKDNIKVLTFLINSSNGEGSLITKKMGNIKLANKNLVGTISKKFIKLNIFQL